MLIAGSNVFQPGEHEYVAGCAVLCDLLKQSTGVSPVFALDWPKKPETFTGTHLHASLAEEGYRRFLVNSILWTAGVEVPRSGAPVSLSSEGLNKSLKIAAAASK